MASREKAFILFLFFLQFAIVCRSGKIIGTLFKVPKLTVGGVTKLLFDCPTPKDDSCPNSDIKYFLYTRNTQGSPHELDPSRPETIENARFIPGAPLKVIIHGYTGHKDFSPNAEIRPAFFERGDYNLLSLDWGTLAPKQCYVQSAKNVQLVAKCAAELLDMLVQTRPEVTLDNTHILGFSLGAHVGGILGNHLKSGKVARVTGFDPALPLFDEVTAPVEKMLNSDAGQLVDVYYSNAGHQGKKSPSGHINVYLNNGASQPGCDCDSSCDHRRSVEYFAESINSRVGMWGFFCQSWSSYVGGSCQLNSGQDLVQLGEYISPSVQHGNYLVFTNSTTPYLIRPSVYFEDGDLVNKVDQRCSKVKYLL